MQLNIREVLRFYDERNSVNSRHASAITGLIGEDVAIAVFCHYARSFGLPVTARNEPCTEGKKKGKWLDKWLFVESDSDRWLYQVEVKNWSAHSIGGKHLAVDATLEQIRDAKQSRWVEQWDELDERFRKKEVDKVLSVMGPPLSDCRVEPLVIFWFAIHPTGADEAFFEVNARGEFKRVFIFSISTYLRSLNSDTIRVDVPRVTERLSILKKLLSEQEEG